jgi:hypothetical protein
MEDPKGRLLATTGLALVGLAILELIGTVAIGLSVKSSRIGFITKQGYAFLTQLEKSPLALMLVGGALLAALITYRAETDERTKTLARLALWAALVAAVVLGVGAVLGVMSRFKVAELSNSQKVDSLTRRVLVVYVIRNFGLAVTTLLIAVGSLFQPKKPVVVDPAAPPLGD